MTVKPLAEPGAVPSVAARRESLVGVGYGLAAFLFWGVAPIYFKLVAHVAPAEILAHRIAWSAVFLALLIGLLRRWRGVVAALASWRLFLPLLLSAAILSANWFLYIVAVNSDQILQASLGYYINPLVNVLLGMLFLKERLRPAQIVAVALAAIGVAVMVGVAGHIPWIALFLGFSFGFYGLIRKMVPVDAISGLSIEAMALTPFALGYIFWLGNAGSFGAIDLATDLLLVAAGLITLLPLLWFNAAAKRLKLSTVGILQYVAPTGQFLLAVLLFDENFTPAHMITFGCIWAGLALYTVDALRRSKRNGQ